MNMSWPTCDSEAALRAVVTCEETLLRERDEAIQTLEGSCQANAKWSLKSRYFQAFGRPQ